MNASEFDIIRRYFTTDTRRPDVVLGSGDDCALLAPPAGKLLAVTTDTLIAGVHFPENTSAADIAYKSIAVSLSDLAAMAAEPAWLTLALTLPAVDTHWLEEFSQAFHQTSLRYHLQLIGGDTTRGPLSITVHATGFVDADKVMRRDTAQPGDGIYVTGTLGDAALGLRLLQADLLAGENSETLACLLSRLNRPEPRLDFARAVSGQVQTAIDISDGLLADLGHITHASQCGARLELDQLPLSSALLDIYENNTENVDLNLVLSGGDDYELCLTVSPAVEHDVQSIAQKLNLRLSRIGTITDSTGIDCINAQGESVSFSDAGFQHF